MSDSLAATSGLREVGKCSALSQPPWNDSWVPFRHLVIQAGEAEEEEGIEGAKIVGLLSLSPGEGICPNFIFIRQLSLEHSDRE